MRPTNNYFLSLVKVGRLSHIGPLCVVQITLSNCVLWCCKQPQITCSKTRSQIDFVSSCFVLYLFRSWLPQGHVKLYAQCQETGCVHIFKVRWSGYQGIQEMNDCLKEGLSLQQVLYVTCYCYYSRQMLQSAYIWSVHISSINCCQLEDALQERVSYR